MESQLLEKLTTEGYIDVSSAKDCSVVKKLLRPAASSERPGQHCNAFIQYTGRLLDGTVFETTREYVDGKLAGGTDEPFEFRIGQGQAIVGFDHAVLSMGAGELAAFVFAPALAYRTAGLPPKVGPDAVVAFEIELLRWGEPLPPLLGPDELARAERRRHDEARLQAELHPEPTLAERIAESTKIRKEGNDIFARKQFAEAIKQYDMAFVQLFVDKETWEMVFSDEQRTMVEAAKLPLHLNRAQAKIREHRWEDAMWDCDQALKIDPGNAKGLLRRGRVRLELLRQLVAKEDSGEYWDPDRAAGMAQLAREDFDGSVASGGDAAYVGTFRRQLAAEESRIQRFKRRLEQEERERFGRMLLRQMERGFARGRGESGAGGAGTDAEAKGESSPRGAAGGEDEEDELPPLE